MIIHAVTSLKGKHRLTLEKTIDGRYRITGTVNDTVVMEAHRNSLNTALECYNEKQFSDWTWHNIRYAKITVNNLGETK
jgi:hypothetical protein